ncbi:putative HTH-type transcriptional regulator YddM [Piscirickettsia salmonis]|uniref:HigA family addiction module antitoxin n=2 Tax=Piscirickettsia salmonis TaxID=1238 RepID=UPI000F095906|nr:HigA family addiction module antitoxin [Piscirickettsia salmonis]RNC76987.1 addiction module antidote protein, HigA family [Piscirickettsiaceae bacterium NZ-RLO2]QGP51442.1 putative HTH-type transcriptional regulator YddM [Piscirickettsia salmonis]QGP56817.1 putative HTH-type transcriptional regulator YddM [Piscirickettsia salmonis]QGP61534.1 putative HTH-type transcriptional regulator YddM [Piscirickettsia salmonis]QGP66390.1 putative HTH-type transcriptional regulator YddM [Piscirickettsi
MSRMHNPPHPGLLLAEMCDGIKEEQGLSRNAIAKHLKVTPGALSNVINGKASVTATMAVKLSKAFSVSAETWLRMQEAFDLWQAEKACKREKIEPLFKPSV